ncbi:MAG: hypothetical protein BMS9Abin33_0824 [Gammaproteobacteria bacterium]|nr:MAG: hypothetical protein BMS9Abin33_0824 [Gammaproteobacteria bacterium]
MEINFLKYLCIFLPLFLRVFNIFLRITFKFPLTSWATEIILISFVGYYNMGPVYVYPFPADWIDMFFHYDFPNYLLRLQPNGEGFHRIVRALNPSHL